MSNPKYPSERKAAYFKGKDDRYLSKLRGNVCSEIVVKAEPSRAMEIALEETRKALDLLRYGILFLFTKERPRAVGVLGEVTEQSRVAIAIRTDNKEANITEERTNFPLELTDETLKRMKDIGIFDLSDVITKKDKTEFEEIILRAVHWLASAQAQNENENTLLNLVTCLETFFKAEAGTPITATISEGVALLTATEVEARKERKRRVADFYGKRSKLTHEGEGLITNADLLELTMIARDLTLWMIRNRSKFRDHESFKGWLEDQKMSAEVRLPS